MGFINLITIGDYVKKSEKYIYEKYGIKKEELQTMQEDDFQQLIVKIIKKYINIDYILSYLLSACLNVWMRKTYMLIVLAKISNIDLHIGLHKLMLNTVHHRIDHLK